MALALQLLGAFVNKSKSEGTSVFPRACLTLSPLHQHWDKILASLTLCWTWSQTKVQPFSVAVSWTRFLFLALEDPAVLLLHWHYFFTFTHKSVPEESLGSVYSFSKLFRISESWEFGIRNISIQFNGLSSVADRLWCFCQTWAVPKWHSHK